MTTDRSVGPGFADLLQRDAVPARATSAMEDPPPAAWLGTLARLVLADQQRATDRPRLTVEAIVAELDRTVSEQLNGILHAHEFQALESTWRGLWMLVRAADTDTGVKVRVLDIGKRELARTLRKFRGNAWDHSPIFHRIYEEEFGQLGGEPYGLLVGDYAFDHRPDDVALLGDVAKIAAAAHAPFLAAAAPSLFQMESWAPIHVT
jgi:type VI secretion system protein ImpC